MKCPGCGQWFDMLDLGKVIEHVHDADIEIEIGEGPEPPACEGGCIEMAEDSSKPWTDEQLQQLADSGATLSGIAEMLARADTATQARRAPSPHASLRSSVNKITWAQVGRVAEPGRYMFTFGWLTITADDLAVWQQYPDAAFTLVGQSSTEAGEGY